MILTALGALAIVAAIGIGYLLDERLHRANTRLNNLLRADEPDDLMALANTLRDTPAMPRQRATHGSTP